MNYIYENLFKATGFLVSGQDGIKDRLETARAQLHPLLSNSTIEIPELSERFASIMQRFGREPNDIGNNPNALDELSPEDASKLASDVFSLFVDYSEHIRRH
jgi:hypothetical protein